MTENDRSEPNVEESNRSAARSWLLKRLKYFLSASFISLVIGIIGIYYTLRGSRTHLSMDITAESNVLDVRHPIPGLAILFQGQDIEEGRSNLKILTIRVVNDGEANIREDDFDSRIAFGLQIDGGRIIRAQVVGANSSYLANNLHPRVDESNRIIFDKVIFDTGKFVTLDLLVLHPKSLNPQVKPLGKIAGLDEIAITNSFQQHEQSSFIEEIFTGSVAVQIARAIAYSFFALIAIITLGFAIAGLASMHSRSAKRRRRRIVSKIPQLDSPERQAKRKAIETIYIEEGLQGLKRAKRFLTSPDAAKKRLQESTLFYEGGSIALDLTREEVIAIHGGTSRFPSFLQPLVSAKFVNMDNDELTIDPDINRLLADVIAQVSGVEKLE